MFRLAVPILDLFKGYNRNVNGKCKLVIVPEELQCFLTPAHESTRDMLHLSEFLRGRLKLDMFSLRA